MPITIIKGSNDNNQPFEAYLPRNGEIYHKYDVATFPTLSSDEFNTVYAAENGYLCGFSTFVIPLIKCILEPEYFYVNTQSLSDNHQIFKKLFQDEVNNLDTPYKDLHNTFKNCSGDSKRLCEIYAQSVKNAYINFLKRDVNNNIADMLAQEYVATDNDIIKIAELTDLRSLIIIAKDESGQNNYIYNCKSLNDANGRVDFAVINAGGAHWYSLTFLFRGEEFDYNDKERFDSTKEERQQSHSKESETKNKGVVDYIVRAFTMFFTYTSRIYVTLCSCIAKIFTDNSNPLDIHPGINAEDSRE